MKKIFWLASALGISVTAAHAQTGSIKIESASGRTIYITNAPKDDTKVMSGSQLDAEIDDLMASNNSRSSFSGVSSALCSCVWRDSTSCIVRSCAMDPTWCSCSRNSYL